MDTGEVGLVVVEENVVAVCDVEDAPEVEEVVVVDGNAWGDDVASPIAPLFV